LTRDIRGIIARLLRFAVLAAFLAEGIAALVFILNASSQHVSIPLAAFGGTLICTAVAIATFRIHPRTGTGQMVSSTPVWAVLTTIMSGLILRILWLAFVPPVQTSDYVRYLQAARNLLATHTYAEFLMGHHFRAFTPPGLPFLLAAGMRVFGDRSWMPAVLNCVLYVFTALLIAVIGKRLAGGRVAILATGLFAIWPSNIGMTGLAASEPLFALLFLLACYIVFLPEQSTWGLSALGGVAAGLATLTRPTALALPVLWVVAALIHGSGNTRWRNSIIATSLLFVTVSPWTMRNHLILGAFIPVSTNGGDVFYRANNPLATGTWAAKGELDLSPYLGDEVQWNKTGFAWGKEWIAAHPLGFLKLAIRKQYIFLGSDETGIYWSIERPYPQWKALDLAGKVLSFLWWLILWVLMLFAVVQQRRAILQMPGLICLLLPFLYLIGIHSIFESQDRYHIPAVPFLILTAALVFGSGGQAAACEEKN
jgi:4-amino-4-deoxy-L-arabinose transferase-like glycosyltransferase